MELYDYAAKELSVYYEVKIFRISGIKSHYFDNKNEAIEFFQRMNLDMSDCVIQHIDHGNGEIISVVV